LSRVLAIARDTGELVALAGGTLARLSGDAEVFVAEAPRGTGDARAGQSVAAAVGAEWLGCVPFNGDDDGRALRDPVMDVIRQATPDLIIVSAPANGERMPLTEIVFNAAYCSTIPNYLSPTGLAPASVRAPIFATDQPHVASYAPDAYVDITEQWSSKLELIDLCAKNGAAGELQDLAEVVSRVRGIQVQVEFAEAFRIEQAWGRLRPYRLLP
jgi:LmbE family N-acetylglucosaminyl deacetylase